VGPRQSVQRMTTVSSLCEAEAEAEAEADGRSPPC
jgi:hypothetical protein